MSSEEILEKVKAIIVEQLGVADTAVTMEASFIDDLGADSLDIVELVMAIEEEFDIEIPDSDAEKVVTVGDVVDYIKENAITESERIVLASSQPWCDYQQLVTLQAFIEANKVPQFITSIGPRITNIPTQLFANELAKTLYTILENLKKLGVKVE